ncbi:phosphoribosylamine--glycine ligase [Lacticaseibacillus thailandensis]|uniref:phosphoribosylamine--glycine ligase n=1 Tax=Lacticaseibacillus thailandensis TaxID=381741 RepID=UPI0006D2CA5E
MQNVLVIGSGARESALGVAFKRSPRVEHVYVAPGNEGMQLRGLEPVALDVLDFAGLVAFARKHVDLTFVGPEVPLVAGIVDYFTAAHLRIFGPHQALAQLEGSKAFAKDFMARHGIPTARAVLVHDADAARAQVRTMGVPVVLKADGLAAGKGVQIVTTTAAADQAIALVYQQQVDAPLLVEEYLRGEEASVMTLFAGQHWVMLPLSQDHKRRFNGDTGPNTGGMGAISPAPQFDATAVQQAQNIVTRTINGIHAEGLDGCGVLYTGLMFTAAGPRVLEYNMRLGDPETQVLLPQLTDDFFSVIMQLLDGQQPRLHLDGRTYCGVVLVHPGYPATSQPPVAVMTPLVASLNHWLPAAVRQVNGQWQSSGGRVVTVVGSGADARAAVRATYQLVAPWADALAYREDIGVHALQ